MCVSASFLPKLDSRQRKQANVNGKGDSHAHRGPETVWIGKGNKGHVCGDVHQSRRSHSLAVVESDEAEKEKESDWKRGLAVKATTQALPN